MQIEWSFLIWLCGGIVVLIIVAVKATVYKITAPLRTEVMEIKSKMTLIEQSHKTIVELIDRLPDLIDEKIKGREELVNKDIEYLKERLSSKQDKI